MEIIGRGFLAQSLEPLAGRYPGVTVLAAGVSSTVGTAPAPFARERDLLAATVRRCRRDGRQVVFFSSASAGMYGRADGDGREDGPVLPRTPYGRHKHALERQLVEADVEHLVLRISHLVGPKQRAHQLVPALIHQVRGGRVRIHRGASRDLIDIVDLVRLADGLLRTGLTRETVNIASGTSHPVDDIVARVERALRTTAVHEYVDPPTGGAAVCIDKLRALLPGTVRTTFGPDYPGTVLDKYVGVLARAHGAARTEGS